MQLRHTIVTTSVSFALVFGFAGAAAAQHSVEDALKVIGSFRGDAKSAATAPASFVPPPRTIKDITAILDQQRPNPATREANLAAANSEPSATLQGRELAAFYYQRSLASSNVGQAQRALADAKQAYTLIKQVFNATAQRIQFASQQIGALQAAGDIRGALDAADEHLRFVGTLNVREYTSEYISACQQKAAVAVRLGMIDLARQTLALGESARDTSVSNDGIAYRAGGRSSPFKRPLLQAQLLHTKAGLFFATGRHVDAEQSLRESIAITTETLIPNETTIGEAAGTYLDQRDTLYGELANVLLRQGRLVNAEAEARRVLLSRLERRGRYAAQSAGNMLLLTAVLFEQGRYADAARLADAARDVYENLGHDKGSFSLIEARRWIAETQVAQGKHDEARATYEALERDIGDDAELHRQFLSTNVEYAMNLLRSGRSQDAVQIIEAVVAQNQKNLGDKAYPTAQARGRLGAALAQVGQKTRAAAEFEAAMPILLASSREAEDSEDDSSSVAQRDSQRQQIVESYLALLVDKGTAAAAETFRLADAVRGQSVQRALAASSARAAASDPTLANLARAEQDAQKQAMALQGLLTNILTLPTTQQDAGAVKKLREDIDTLRTARARVREEIEKRFPDYVNLIDPRPATIDIAQKSLKPGEALIATYAGAERLFVWAIPHQGNVAYASSKIKDTELEALVTGLRHALDPNVDSIEAVPAFDVAAAHKLYTMLLKPVEGGWINATSLMIVPHKMLGLLPMGALVTESTPQPTKAALPFAEYKRVPFLARKVAVTQLPSVNALATLRALPAPKGEREALAAFGDPWFSPEQAKQAKAQTPQVAQAGLQTRGIPLIRRSAPKTDGVDSAELALLPRLPDTADEVKSIALAMRADVSKAVFLGDAANEKTVKTMNLANRKVIMFATHGLMPGDLNGLSQPALALTAPNVANVEGDGLLTMEEVLALKLNADWVVLSACNTASGSGAGAEALSGLGRAFFYAGTRALLVSNWPVETVSARTLTTDLFRRQAEDPTLARGEAMRQAEIALIDGPGAGQFSYAHPIFWAPFTVVGDGG